MRKIAIITTRQDYYDYESSITIINSITDWAEVDEETYELLDRCKYNGEGFYIIEQPIEQSQFILKTVAEYKAHLLKVEEERKLKKAAETEKRAKKKQINEARRIEKLKAELAKLESKENV